MIDLTTVLNPGKESSSMFDVSHIAQPIIQTLSIHVIYREHRGCSFGSFTWVHVGIVCFQQVNNAMYTKYSHVQEMSR